MKRKLMVSGVAIVLIVVTTLLLYFNFKDAYLLNLPQTDELTVELLERELEYSLSLGIELEKYYGLDRIVETFERQYALSDGLCIMDASGRVIYGDQNSEGWARRSAFKEIQSSEGLDDYNGFIKPQGFLSVTRLDGADSVSGYIVSSVNNGKINRVIFPYLLKSIAIYTIVILFYGLFFREKILKAHILKHAVIVQSVASIIRIYVYYGTIRDSVLTQFGYIIEILKEKLYVVSAYKIPLESIRGVEAFVDSVAGKIDAFENVRLVMEPQGLDVQYDIASKYVMQLLGTSVLDTLVLSVLLTFFLLEVINIHNVGLKSYDSHDPEILRGLGFVYFLGYYTSVLFVPLRMLELLKDGTYAFGTEVMMGLPVSLEAIIVGISSIAIVKHVEKHGFKHIFFTGVCLLVSGFYISYLVENPYLFILARMVIGLGHGICLIVMRGYIVTNPETESIGQGVTAFSIGVFSSLNIGCVLGGIVGDYFGLRHVFLLSGILMTLPGFLSGVFIKSKTVPKRTKTRLSQDFMSLLNEHCLIVGILLFMLPLRILSGYLEYFFPVVATSGLNWSFSDVSRGYLLNSMIIILAGFNLVVFLSRRVSLVKRLYLGLIVMIVSVAIMGMTMNSVGMVLSIAVLSVPLAFMEGAFLEYYTGFQSTQAMGSMKAMGFYTLFDRGIMYIVPYVYAIVISKNTGWGLMGLLAGICVVLIGMGILESRLKRRSELENGYM